MGRHKEYRRMPVLMRGRKKRKPTWQTVLVDALTVWKRRR